MVFACWSLFFVHWAALIVAASFLILKGMAFLTNFVLKKSLSLRKFINYDPPSERCFCRFTLCQLKNSTTNLYYKHVAYYDVPKLNRVFSLNLVFFIILNPYFTFRRWNMFWYKFLNLVLVFYSIHQFDRLDFFLYPISPVCSLFSKCIPSPVKRPIFFHYHKFYGQFQLWDIDGLIHFIYHNKYHFLDNHYHPTFTGAKSKDPREGVIFYSFDVIAKRPLCHQAKLSISRLLKAVRISVSEFDEWLSSEDPNGFLGQPASFFPF